MSNLPYSATSVDLQTLFSDFAPVRTAFVVLDKVSKVSKGVGYVSFAMREDAARAITDAQNLELDGRKLRVQVPTKTVSLFFRFASFGTRQVPRPSSWGSVTFLQTRLQPLPSPNRSFPFCFRILMPKTIYPSQRSILSQRATNPRPKSLPGQLQKTRMLFEVLS